MGTGDRRTGRGCAFLLLAFLALGPAIPANAQTTVSICDRTEAVRDTILTKSGATSCGSVTSAQLASISRLRLHNSGMTSLKSGDFDGLSGLSRLELYGNELDSLPSDVFSGLSSLSVLQMSYNSLDALPPDVFSGLTSLVELNVSHNELTALPSDVFSGLSSLLFLYLDGNDIAALPAGVFSGVPSLRMLFLYDNDFTTFPANTFTVLESLSWLTLEGGALTTLPAGAFADLAGLQKLDLSNNSLGTIPADVLSGANSLDDLVLSGNALSALPDGLFSGLSSLGTLWLQDNSVDSIPLEVSLVSTSDGNVKATVHTGAPSEIRVPLTVTNGTLGAGTVTIPAGSIESAAVTVTPSANGQAVTVDVGTLPGLPDLGTYTHYWGDRNPAHYGYYLKRSTDLPLALNQAGPSAVSLVLTPASISENGGSTTVTATASPAASAAFSVTVSTAAVSPATSSDFTLSGSTLSFAVGATASSGTITITAADNDTDAANKTVTVSGTIATSGADATAPADRTLTITDDDAASTTVALSVDPDEVAEDDAATTITVTGTLNAGARTSATDVTVTVGSGSGTGAATSGTDFTAVSDFTLAIPANATSGTETFTLTPTDDSDVETDETVSVAGSATGLTVTGTTITITNDDAPPPFTAEFLNVPANHDGESTFTFELRFSEAFRVSYKKIRDRVLNVTGGEVTNAARLVKKSSLRWNITIQPSSDDSVVIVLPSRPCSPGRQAVCTDDRRPLSDTVSATVSGPVAGSVVTETPTPIVLDVPPEVAAAALLGEHTLTDDQLSALDQLGNANGRYDLGDLLSWIARCDRGEPSCAQSSSSAPDSPSAPGAALPGTKQSGSTGNRRKPKAGRRRRRQPAPHRYGVAMLLAAAMTWACADGAGISQPLLEEPDPGFLTVELTAPSGAGDIGALVELQGPAVDSLRAPGRELIASGTGSPRQVIVAGSLSSGPLVQFWVPDRRLRGQYQIRILEIAAGDFTLAEIADYSANIP